MFTYHHRETTYVYIHVHVVLHVWCTCTCTSGVTCMMYMCMYTEQLYCIFITTGLHCTYKS